MDTKAATGEQQENAEDLSTVSLDFEVSYPSLDEKSVPSTAVAREEKTKVNRAKFICRVANPEKKGEGMSQYIAYQVNTTMDTSPGVVSESSVDRRYSDFAWLQEKLQKDHRGVLIPPIPDKQIIGHITGDRFSGDFINERQRGLEKFLNRIACHHILQNSKAVEVFLHADDAAMAAARVDNKQPEGKQDRGFLNFFRETAQSLSNTFGVGEQRPKTADDISCEAVTEYAGALETSLENVHTTAVDLVDRSRGMANCWFGFALACTMLGQFESKNEEEALGQVCAKLGSCADRLSILMTQKADEENVHFREPLKDYLKYTQAVQEMCRTRAAVQLTYQTSMSVLEGRQESLTKEKGQPGREEKAAAMERSVEEAQKIADQDKAELERVTALCLAEAARFRREKEEEIRRVVINFVKLQINHSKEVQKAWETVLPEIDGAAPESS